MSEGLEVNYYYSFLFHKKPTKCLNVFYVIFTVCRMRKKSKKNIESQLLDSASNRSRQNTKYIKANKQRSDKKKHISNEVVKYNQIQTDDTKHLRFEFRKKKI